MKNKEVQFYIKRSINFKITLLLFIEAPISMKYYLPPLSLSNLPINFSFAISSPENMIFNQVYRIERSGLTPRATFQNVGLIELERASLTSAFNNMARGRS